MGRNKLLIIQEFMTKYRIPVYKELTNFYDVKFCFSLAHEQVGFFSSLQDFPLKEEVFISKRISFKIFYYQLSKLKYVFNVKPDVIFMAGNLRDLSFWLLLLFGRVMGYKMVIHGQGPFNKQEQNSILRKLMYGSILFLSDKYICYNEFCLQSFVKLKIPFLKKVCYVNNVVNYVNDLPEIKQKEYSQLGILFVGRLRSDSNFENLLLVVRKLRKHFYGLKIHLVGDLVTESNKLILDTNKDIVIYHGKTHSFSELKNVAKSCSVGCYPGDAGLSVVTYLALGLGVVVHNDLYKHKGPEVAYLSFGEDSLSFKRENWQDLEKVLYEALNSESLRKNLGRNAYHKFLRLNEPSYGTALHAVIGKIV